MDMRGRSGTGDRRSGGVKDEVRNESCTESESFSESEADRPQKRRRLSHVAVYGPEFPRSRYRNWRSSVQRSSEQEAISDLKDLFHSSYASIKDKPDFVAFELDGFSCYRPPGGTHAYELSALDRLQNRGGCNEFLVDGILNHAGERRYVQGVRFSTLSIDGYGDPEVTSLSHNIYVQSYTARREDVWYRLGTPAPEYRRFFSPFLWLVEFTKHFVDFLLDHESVTLKHFRRDFYGWLFSSHSADPRFMSWSTKCNLIDFRTTVAANVGFLWKECHGIEDGATGLLDHPIWGEVDPVKLTAIPRHELAETNTIVTPFAYECFRRKYFAQFLQPRNINNNDILEAVVRRKQSLNLTPFTFISDPGAALPTPKSMSRSPPASSNILDITEGDVVRVQPDEQGSWRSESSCWYAYVQGVRASETTTELDILWMYQPSDTTIGKAFYPFRNEIFLSDNCGCGKDALDISCVLEKVDVKWFVSDPDNTSGLFVRRKFRTIHDEDTYDFVALKQSDFSCNCTDTCSLFEDCRRKFNIGDTVLYREYNFESRDDRLEPGQIVDFILQRQRVLVRRLARKIKHEHTARPNELVLTEGLIDKSPSMIIRPCHVRFFHTDVLLEGLPTPYDRNGTGDFFFVIRDAENSGLQTPASLSDVMSSISLHSERPSKFPPIEEGWDAEGETSSAPKLKGMGIFCGGGNLDRGLEEGGAVVFDFAVDYDIQALHTYRANAKNAARLQCFLGSVDDYLHQALTGSRKEVIAQVGEVEVLSAGSPCPGFSNANIRKQDARALKNCSMVASVISYVDLYSPKYCILENVVPMAQERGPNKDQNVFQQLIASFVALGYQVQQYLMEAWFFGSCEQRSRVFIIASAPGATPFPAPAYTHSHWQSGGKWTRRKLGLSSNGLPFGTRKEQYAAFDHVSPLQATRDLPYIGDSLPQLCPAFPDHRTPSDLDNLARSCVSLVPTHPRGMGFVQAVKEGERQKQNLNEEDRWLLPISGEPLAYYQSKVRPNSTRNRDRSTLYTRIDPYALFPTILTVLHTADGINGRSMHWEQHRSLTVMEARRAQGIPDDEVIIGTTGQQWRVIGNSVERKVALTLGLSLRASWANGLHQED